MLANPSLDCLPLNTLTSSLRSAVLLHLPDAPFFVRHIPTNANPESYLSQAHRFVMAALRDSKCAALQPFSRRLFAILLFIFSRAHMLPKIAYVCSSIGHTGARPNLLTSYVERRTCQNKNKGHAVHSSTARPTSRAIALPSLTKTYRGALPSALCLQARVRDRSCLNLSNSTARTTRRQRAPRSLRCQQCASVWSGLVQPRAPPAYADICPGFFDRKGRRRPRRDPCTFFDTQCAKDYFFIVFVVFRSMSYLCELPT
jgi:hypothetical protein